jgi:hypothetical protein
MSNLGLFRRPRSTSFISTKIPLFGKRGARGDFTIEMRDNPILYEINTATWLYSLSRENGREVTIGSVPEEQWDILKSRGFNSVWLMGVWKRSKEGMRIFRNTPEWPPMRAHLDSVLPGWSEADIAGSPYSIASYDPDPLIGTWNDLDKAREELHKREMTLILDFVPNHTAPDHTWILEHPDYYLQGNAEEFTRDPVLFSRIDLSGKTSYVRRGKDPYFPPWSDTAQLNHFNPGLRSSLAGELERIAGHCDGVRCDMAMLVLNDIFSRNWGWVRERTSYAPPATEFWSDVRQRLPGFLLIAEAYWDTEWRLQQMGFDFVYDKKLYDKLKSAGACDINMHLHADISFQKKLVRFIENHDEPRSAEAFDTDKLHAAAVLFSTLPGMKLYHQGQLEGRRTKVPVLLRRQPDEQPDEGLMAFYAILLSIANRDIFAIGEWKRKDAVSAGDESYKNLVSYIWRLDEQFTAVIVNFSPHHSQGRILLQEETDSDTDFALCDKLNNQTYSRTGRELASPGLHVILEGFHCHIFDISPVPGG